MQQFSAAGGKQDARAPRRIFIIPLKYLEISGYFQLKALKWPKLKHKINTETGQ